MSEASNGGDVFTDSFIEDEQRRLAPRRRDDGWTVRPLVKPELYLSALREIKLLRQQSGGGIEGREGIVTVYDSMTGEYRGCMSWETWATILEETRWHDDMNAARIGCGNEPLAFSLRRLLDGI